MPLDILLLFGPISDLFTALSTSKQTRRAPYKIRRAARPIKALLLESLRRHPPMLAASEVGEFRKHVEELRALAEVALREESRCNVELGDIAKRLIPVPQRLSASELPYSEIFSLLQDLRSLG